VSITLGFLVVIVGGLILYNYFTQGRLTQQEQATRPGEPTITKTVEEKLQALPTIHTVVTGENLWKIALERYGSGYNWVTLQQANNLSNPDHIEVGQKLSVPAAEVIVPASDKMLATSTQQTRDYTVVKGDNLWKIALQESGSGYGWTQIAKLNNLANPDLIYPGNMLKIPGK